MKKASMILGHVKNSVNAEFIVKKVFSYADEIAFLEGGLFALESGIIKELEIPRDFTLYYHDEKRGY
jgi:hypothetical protein